MVHFVLGLYDVWLPSDFLTLTDKLRTFSLSFRPLFKNFDHIGTHILAAVC